MSGLNYEISEGMSLLLQQALNFDLSINIKEPAAEWKEIIDIRISQYSLRKVMQIYEQWGIKIYVWNIAAIIPEDKFQEIRIKIYYKK